MSKIKEAVGEDGGRLVTTVHMNDSEQERLDDWINSRPELRHLLDHAHQLADLKATQSR